MSEAYTLLAVVAALVVAYAALSGRLQKFVQPVRLRLADSGESLLERNQIPEQHRAVIQYCLDHAFSAWPMFAVSVMMLPSALTPDQTIPPLQDKELEQDFDEFLNLFVTSAAAANPICAIIAVSEVLLLVIILAILGQTSQTLSKILRRALAWEEHIAVRSRDVLPKWS